MKKTLKDFPIGSVYEVGTRGIKYEIIDHDCDEYDEYIVLECIKARSDLFVGKVIRRKLTNISHFKKVVTLSEEKKIESNECKCDIWLGCTCGVFEREQELKKKS